MPSGGGKAREGLPVLRERRTNPGVLGMRKTVLLVTTDYPPLAGTNTRRVESFARYLPEYDWTPLVLTLAIEDMALIESSWVSDGAVETERVRTPGLQPLVRRLRGQRPRRTKEGEDDAGDGTDGAAHGEGAVWRTALGAVWGLVVALERASYVPDPRRLWSAAASRAALRLAAKRRIDAVVTSSPPFSAHFVGMRLQRRLGIPWVADLRDLWVGRPYRFLPYRWQHHLDAVYESRVIGRADRLSFASPGWVPVFQRRYGSGVAEKITIITNGFDAAMLESNPVRAPARGRGERTRPITMAYTGALHEGESPWPLIHALARVAEQAGAERVRSGFQLRFMGPGDADWDGPRAYLRERGLDGVMRFLGTRSHAESLAEQRGADVLLILSAPPHDETIRGKSFEYMATGKPIFALLPEGSTQAEILEPSGLATIVPYGDVERSARVLAGYLESGVPVVRANWEYIKTFDRRNLAGALAAVLDGCVGTAGTG